MTISESQKEQFQREGSMIIPGFLDEDELEMVRDTCDPPGL